MHFAQSESAKADSSNLSPFLNINPAPGAPFKYLNSLKAIWEWAEVGLCIY
ncbi:hypothetical protein HanXRQr2_Chr10g0424611 [Helianthus annuus]|uniref:Uncharacterized protein n=1 Tax=Helianthus annuus TaxID=4232 RepID=A0A9K3HUV3_HELAN|nr:hypothetical protein HanXRQr2_Chr10g0424611 [Helianthus annuus]